MKKILVKKMKILNFKGISELLVDFDGNNFSVYGANGIGKTTLVDAFCWCLWGKDSRNQADFDIKPIVDGVPMSKAEHIVELILQNGEQEISFERTFLEKWTKPRGALEFEFKGHETKYKVNAEPLTLRQYNEVVSTLIDSKTFALLSNPLFFNENLKWEERRELLMKIAGDISVADIVKNNAKLAELASLSESEIATHKKIADSQASKIRKDIADIPVRISELQRTLPKQDEIMCASDYKDAQHKISILEQEITNLSLERGKISAKTFNENEELQNLRAELASAQYEHHHKCYEKGLELNKRTNDAFAVVDKHNQTLRELINEKNEVHKKMIMAQLHKENLLKHYHEIKGKEFPKADIVEVCPTCHQPVPIEKLEEARQNYESNRKAFNLDKSKKLTEIVAEGEEYNKIIAKHQDEEQAVQQMIDKQQELVNLSTEQYLESKREMDNAASRSLADTPTIIELKDKIAELTTNMLVAKGAFYDNIQEQISVIDVEINDKQKELRDIMASIAKYENSIKTRNRIDELLAEERVLNEAHEQHRIMSWKCEQYLLAKINYINSLIVNKFNIANFVLFRKNISNDGIEQCCDTLVNDIPYKSINDAARINVGMDIISTLIDYYGVAVPIFVDNAESVTDLNMINGKTQIIRLVVSKEDSQLRFVKE